MTAIGWDFVQQDQSELVPRTMGELLASFVRRRWPRNTAKQVQRAWDIDPSTADNLIRGRASERTITKALRAEGWPLLMAMGEAMTGQAYQDFLQGIVDERERATQQAKAAQAAFESLEARAASVLSVAAGADVAHSGHEPFRSWAPTDGLGDAEVPARRLTERGA